MIDIEKIRYYIEKIKRGEGVRIDDGTIQLMMKLYNEVYHKTLCMACDGDKIRALELILKKYSQ